MGSKQVLVVSVVALLGVLSFGTGFGAEFTRITASDIAAHSTTYCVYPESPAMALGLTAAASLLVAQVILNASTGCSCCKSILPSNGKLRVFCVLSWLTFFIAMRLFLSGVAINDGMVNGNDKSYFGYLRCYYVKAGVFAGGAVLSGVSVMLGVFYFLAVTNSAKDADNASGTSASYYHDGIAVGQPQFPPHNT